MKQSFDDDAFLSLFGYQDSHCTVKQLWRFLMNRASPELNPSSDHALEVILSLGPLARRLAAIVQQRGTERSHLRPVLCGSVPGFGEWRNAAAMNKRRRPLAVVRDQPSRAVAVWQSS